MKSYKASQVIKQFRMIEGGNESAFQAILTLVFLFKTNFDGVDGTGVAIISLIGSLLSLISRLSIIDKNCLIKAARDIDELQFKQLFSNPVVELQKIRKEWIFHRLFRCIEILFSIFLISIFWHIAGGVWLLFLMIIAVLNVYLQYQTPKLSKTWQRICVRYLFETGCQSKSLKGVQHLIAKYRTSILPSLSPSDGRAISNHLIQTIFKTGDIDDTIINISILLIENEICTSVDLGQIKAMESDGDIQAYRQFEAKLKD